MFEQLIFPLKQARSIKLRADLVDETAAVFHQHDYDYQEIDIILLEGIFLFKNEFQGYFDLRIWVECPFETALGRAIERAQENLSPEEARDAYETIYFPAQGIHFARDNPKDSADLIWFNS
jgi:uridine kinase